MCENIKNNDGLGRQSICPICGKAFTIEPFTAWKIGKKTYCSYTCFRVDEKKKIEKQNRTLKQRVFKLSDMPLSEIQKYLTAERVKKYGKLKECGRECYCADCKEEEIHHKNCCAKAYRRYVNNTENNDLKGE